MKATIARKTYNTETATLIGSWSNGCFTTDFAYLSEDLYRTARGAFFVAGEGGARSSYAQSYGSNSVGGGAAIRPLTKDEALDWCEEHDCQDAIEEHFSEMVAEAAEEEDQPTAPPSKYQVIYEDATEGWVPTNLGIFTDPEEAKESAKNWLEGYATRGQGAPRMAMQELKSQPLPEGAVEI
jgi:hypothetical protein